MTLFPNAVRHTQMCQISVSERGRLAAALAAPSPTEAVSFLAEQT